MVLSIWLCEEIGFSIFPFYGIQQVQNIQSLDF